MIQDDQDTGQSGRMLQMESELGPDRLILTSVRGQDAVSRPFVFKIEFATQAEPGAVSSLLGRPLLLTLGGNHPEHTRPVHGMVRRLAKLHQTLRGWDVWDADVVPRFAFLAFTGDCRVFQNASVPDILRKVLNEHGVKHEVRSLVASYKALEYCVQYRESTLSFLSRLMEEAGLFYWHEHADDGHVMVIADSNSMARSAVSATVTQSVREDLGAVQSLEPEYAFRPGKWTTTDYDFETPGKNLQVNAPTTLAVPQITAHEVYDYPGGFTEKDAGSFLIRRRIEMEEAQHHRLHGTASTCGFDAGRQVEVLPLKPDGEASKYLLLEVSHTATDRTYVTGDAAPPTYAARFTALPLSVPFRPELRTHKPVVRGIQTATVTGPAGEAIYTDKHGRVKLRFHWDRNPDSNRDENSSCWVRVSQSWAGAGWGSVNIPHVGHEVVVSFLEGDPDRPLVTGRVYNGKNAKAAALPANKTQSAMRDHSGNEIVLEGKAGSQDIRVHAVKDMNTTVDNNCNVLVKAHRTEKVDVGHEVTVAAGWKETITGGFTSTIDGGATHTVTGGLTTTVNGPWDSTVNGKLTETVTSGESRTVSSGQSLTVSGGSTEEITGKFETTVNGDRSHSTTGKTDIHATGAGTYTSHASLTLSVGGSTIEIKSGSITLTSGPSSIKLDAAGVSVTGPKISLNG